VTHTPFCPAGLEKFFFTDVEYCNGKNIVTIGAGAFFSALAIYGAYLIPASCISCCIAERHSQGCYTNRTTCWTITSIIFPPFIAFVMLYMGGFSVYLGFLALLRNTSRVYAFVFPPPPPPPPPLPNPCFPTTDCGICGTKAEVYLLYGRCGHVHCKKCTTNWRIGDFSADPPRPPHFGCPTCRREHSSDYTFPEYTIGDIDRFVAEKKALEAEKAAKIAAAAATYAARFEARSTLAIRIDSDPVTS
jgi:hypothetical protein